MLSKKKYTVHGTKYFVYAFYLDLLIALLIVNFSVGRKKDFAENIKIKRLYSHIKRLTVPNTSYKELTRKHRVTSRHRPVKTVRKRDLCL